MTPAAPPEKMTPLEYYGQHKDNCVPGQGAYDEPPEPCSCGFDEAVHMAREAARRLAPRVGDDVREALLLYVKWGTLHENSECPEDDTCTCYVARTVNAALSAPPAASADERTDLAWVIDPQAFDDGPFSTDTGDKQRQQTRQGIALTLADNILAAGYRKRAALPKGQEHE